GYATVFVANLTEAHVSLRCEHTSTSRAAPAAAPITTAPSNRPAGLPRRCGTPCGHAARPRGGAWPSPVPDPRDRQKGHGAPCQRRGRYREVCAPPRNDERRALLLTAAASSASHLTYAWSPPPWYSNPSGTRNSPEPTQSTKEEEEMSTITSRT